MSGMNGGTTRVVPGAFTFRPVDPLTDSELLHSWLTHPKAAYWMMLDARLEDVERAYMAVAADEHQQAFLGLEDGVPVFVMERYDPVHRELTGLYDPLPGDVGMHFLTPATDTPRSGFTLAVITAVMAHLFEDPAVERVVVEPDVSNTAVHALNEAVGFVAEREIQKPEKTALLSFCTREHFLDATAVTA
ncbi:GNAT family N-acetyltransferase [Streptomyces sp. 4F14]|uniref:GNAT family N-acetyltransferase n=1 Tax=Streptomyces sp. 4F14 TaxID=3394380 RepID=UPI003A85D137